MDVRLLYFDGCPSWQLAAERIRAALDSLGVPQGVLRLQKVETPQEAERVGFRGSPTVLVDGRDVFADESAPVGLSCRVFSTPEGLAGAPTHEQLLAALRPASPG